MRKLKVLTMSSGWQSSLEVVLAPSPPTPRGRIAWVIACVAVALTMVAVWLIR